MAKMEFELTDDQYNKLLEEAKNEVRKELTDEVVANYIAKDIHSISLREYLRRFDIYSKADDIEHSDTKVRDLTTNEKFILALSWLGYDQLMR